MNVKRLNDPLEYYINFTSIGFPIYPQYVEIHFNG